jgi:hypothetical protein
MPITPTVTVIGLSTRLGTLPELVDGDEGEGWAPYANRLTSLTSTFTDAAGAPNVGKAFACLQFDFGVATRVPLFLVQTETEFTLGDCMLIGSDEPAVLPTDIVKTGDVLLGLYPRHQVVAGAILATAMKESNIAKRYLRMVFHATGALMTPEGTPSETGGSSANSVWFDTGAGNWSAGGWPDNATKLIIEGWGGGASGGVSANAQDGGNTTCSTFSLVANGGDKSATTTPNTTGTPAPGGTASGGDIANTTGGDGGVPSPANNNAGVTGKGGDAPNGGLGGAGIVSVVPSSPGGMRQVGNDGAAPGGGGSGRHQWIPSGDLLASKYPGGAAGGYFRHELTLGGMAPEVEENDLIAYAVGNGGVSTQPDGRGAQGRIKFSWI